MYNTVTAQVYTLCSAHHSQVQLPPLTIQDRYHTSDYIPVLYKTDFLNLLSTTLVSAGLEGIYFYLLNIRLPEVLYLPGKLTQVTVMNVSL